MYYFALTAIRLIWISFGSTHQIWTIQVKTVKWFCWQICCFWFPPISSFILCSFEGNMMTNINFRYIVSLKNWKHLMYETTIWFNVKNVLYTLSTRVCAHHEGMKHICTVIIIKNVNMVIFEFGFGSMGKKHKKNLRSI